MQRAEATDLMFRVLMISRTVLSTLVALMALVGAACSAPAIGPSEKAAKHSAANLLTIVSGDREHDFSVELAASQEERQVGLMFRTELPENAGMLFDFGLPPKPQSMWMKNTLIPLDIAFIDETGTIRRIAADTTPQSLETISSGVPIIAVLEVNAGTFARLGISEGDRVQHPVFQRR